MPVEATATEKEELEGLEKLAETADVVVASFSQTDKSWGSEQVFTDTPSYCGKLLQLNAGAKSSVHLHKLTTETLFVHRGEIVVQAYWQQTNAEQQQEWHARRLVLHEGKSVTIPAGTLHQFLANETSVLLETASRNSRDDTYRLAEAPRVPKENILNGH